MKCPNEDKCFRKSHICDDFKDCSDGFDESFCEKGDNKIINQTCDSLLSYTCQNGRCIPLYKHCDEVADCLEHEDESSCGIIY